MNIGIVTTWFERGAAYVSRQYVQALERDHTVFIYARGGEERAVGDPAWDHHHVHWGRPSALPVPTSIDRNDFYRWVQRNAITLVIFNEQHWWTPVQWCHDLGIRCGTYVDYYTEETVPLFDAYDFLLCNTERHRSVFQWHPQCLFIPWGTDVNLFTYAPDTSDTDRPLVFFHSAGFSPERKGTDLVLSAFARVNGESRLFIHIQRNAAALQSRYADIVEPLIRAGRLTIQEGTIPAPGLYHRGDVYVYPTRLEGIGLTVPEALASGLPVITCDHPPMNEFVHHGRNGRLVEVDRYVSRSDGYYWPQCFANETSLVNAMQWYIDHRAEIASLRLSAREDAVQHRDWSVNSSTLSHRLESITRRTDAGRARALQRIASFEQKRPFSRWMRLAMPFLQMKRLVKL